MNHLDQDQLIDCLYGLEPHHPHLASCPECRGRLNVMRERREAAAADEERSPAFLAGQRRRIYERIEQPATRLSWIPALAAACLLAIGVFVYRPAGAPPPAEHAGDAQLFSEVYSMEQSVEPMAGTPIHDLFEDNQ